MKRNPLLMFYWLVTFVLLLVACTPAATSIPVVATSQPTAVEPAATEQPAATAIPPTATPRPTSTPLPSATPTPTPSISLVDNGQEINNLAGVGVALGDLNGDGHLDAFVANQEGPDGKGDRVYLGDGQGQFVDSGQILLTSDWGVLAMGDINADGRLEVVTGGTVWLNDGQGNLTAHPELIERAETGQLMAPNLADLNGDGSLDLFAITDYDAARVYFNDGQGHFRDSGQKLGDGAIGTGQLALVALGDLNGDHAIDAVTGGWRWDGSVECPNHVWFNDGQGNFTDSGQLLDEGNSHAHGLALGDLNGDGYLDLVMSIQDPSRGGRVYLNDGKGNLVGDRNLGSKMSNGLALGDFDGDGTLDVFLANAQGPNTVWLNDGAGRFHDSGVRLSDTTSIWNWQVAVGDFNADGKLDAFVVACKSNDVSRGSPAQIWLNTSSFEGSKDMAKTSPALVEVPFGSAPVLDGTLSTDEWAGAYSVDLADGGRLLLVHDGQSLYLGLHASKLIVGSISIDDGDQIRVLHSSAALGTAIYKKEGGDWQLMQGFTWTCRDTSNSDQAQAARAKHLQEEGWLASNALVGIPGDMEYQIVMPENTVRLAVAFIQVDDQKVFWWPEKLSDDCRNVDLIGGDPPKTAQFLPEQWATALVSQ